MTKEFRYFSYLKLDSSVVTLQNQTPAQTPADPINHNDTPRFYGIKLLAKMKLITKINNWTYIRVITTTLNDQNHILENCIGSVINFFILTQVPFVYMERAGFMTCTAANHQGAIKEPAASLFTRCETHPCRTMSAAGALLRRLWLQTNLYCADSGSKWRHFRKMATAILRWFSFTFL